MIIKINSEIIKLDKKFQRICKLPYYGHSKGCPNYAEKKGCPPGLPLLNEIFDFSKEMYTIYTSFSIGEFAERMRITHPGWKNHPRQWYNPRRWQGPARKEHRLELEKFLKEHPSYEYSSSPEAHGVNVTDLMNNIGIKLSWQWPPEHNLKNLSYIVSIGGIKSS
jgi:predicted metal-binding protein